MKQKTVCNQTKKREILKKIKIFLLEIFEKVSIPIHYVYNEHNEKRLSGWMKTSVLPHDIFWWVC